MPRDKLLTLAEAAEILRVDARVLTRYHNDSFTPPLSYLVLSHFSAF